MRVTGFALAKSEKLLSLKHRHVSVCRDFGRDFDSESVGRLKLWFSPVGDAAVVNRIPARRIRSHIATLSRWNQIRLTRHPQNSILCNEAQRGAEATAQMKPRLGRSSYLRIAY